MTLPLVDDLPLRVRDVRRSRTFSEQALEPFGVKVVESSQGPGFAIEAGGDLWIGEGEPPAAPVHVASASADEPPLTGSTAPLSKPAAATTARPGSSRALQRRLLRSVRHRPGRENVEAVFHGDR